MDPAKLLYTMKLDPIRLEHLSRFRKPARFALGMLLLVSLLSGAEEKTTEKKPADSLKSDTSASQTPARLGGAPIDPKSYIIGPEDILGIRVWREPELSGDLPVRPDGKVSLQLVNEIQAAGLTPERLAASIAEHLSKFMTSPEVTVAVLKVNSKKYFISGEVQKPGAFPLLIPTTVLEALVNAGGFRDFANTKKIVVLRGPKRMEFNYKEVVKGKKMEQNILLESGDHIVVP